MRTLIMVRRKHIKDARPISFTHCPVGNAVSEVLGRRVAVHSGRIGPYRCPRSAQRFITRFDRGKPVKPFNFFLDIK